MVLPQYFMLPSTWLCWCLPSLARHTSAWTSGGPETRVLLRTNMLLSGRRLLCMHMSTCPLVACGNALSIACSCQASLSFGFSPRLILPCTLHQSETRATAHKSVLRSRRRNTKSRCLCAHVLRLMRCIGDQTVQGQATITTSGSAASIHSMDGSTYVDCCKSHLGNIIVLESYPARRYCHCHEAAGPGKDL
jgi:hypothetical protein